MRTYQRRTALVAVLFLSMAGLAGCHRQRGAAPSPPLEVRGTAYPDGAARESAPWRIRTKPGAAPLPAAFEGALTATGVAEVAAQALDPLEGRLIAKQEARHQARRHLARQIEELEIEDDRTVGDVLGEDADKRDRVEALLQGARQEGVIRDEGGRYSVTLTLNLAPLGEVLRSESTAEDSATSEPETSETASATTGSAETSRQALEERAVATAREEALSLVRSLRVRQGGTMGLAMTRDPDLDRLVRERIEQWPARSIRVRDDGSCEAILEIDLQEMQDLLNRGEGSRK